MVMFIRSTETLFQPFSLLSLLYILTFVHNAWHPPAIASRGTADSATPTSRSWASRPLTVPDKHELRRSTSRILVQRADIAGRVHGARISAAAALQYQSLQL